MRFPDDSKAKLEQAIDALRHEQPDAAAAERASERVWQQLAQAQAASPRMATASVDSIRGCNDVRALLPQYQSGKLVQARALLVQAHLHECAGCRQESERTRSAPAVMPWKRELPKTRQNHFRWLATAAAVIVVAIATFYIQDKLAIPAGARARVESMNGGVYLVGATSERALQPGAELNEGEKVRTAGNSHAMLRLRDGSVVEMNEHAQFSVTAKRKDTTIDLDRGDIIVQAAKRTSGHLYVAAQDCKVSVTGTVFSVNSGMKGSRVSVIAGEVRVAHAGALNILHPGEQVTTTAAVAAMPVQQEIAWSQNLDKHLSLLAEFAHLQNKLQRGVQLPGLRYESKLLPLLPKNTLVYAGIPNLADAIQQADKLFQQELAESAVLRDWWEHEVQAGHGAMDFQTAIEKVHELGAYLGNEIVFSASREGVHGSALVIAEVAKPGLKEFIQSLATQSGAHGEHLRIFTEQELMQAPAQGKSRGLVIVVRPDLVVAGFDLAEVRDFDVALNHGGGGFSATPFAERLLQAYQGGAGLLFGADLQQLKQQDVSVKSPKQQAGLEFSGLADVKYLIGERKDTSGQALNRAELSFNSPRHGAASWLAAPAPIGGLDYVSQNAGAVAAAVTKNPGLIFDDVLAIANANENGDAGVKLAQAESELKIRFRDDLVNTLGGEVTVALDGPLLPTPAWKVIVEVNDSARLQQSIQQLVADANAKLGGQYKATLEQQVVDGTTYTTIHCVTSNKPVDVTYTFTDGYMVIAPTRAMVMDAINIHKNGNSLAKSGDFQKLLPPDQFANVSALIYQNLAPVIGPVAQQLSPAQMESFKAIAAETKPSLVCAYGAESAIRVASTSRFFGLDLNTLMLTNLMKITEQHRHARADAQKL